MTTFPHDVILDRTPGISQKKGYMCGVYDRNSKKDVLWDTLEHAPLAPHDLSYQICVPSLIKSTVSYSLE